MSGEVLGMDLDDRTRDALLESLARSGEGLRETDAASLTQALQGHQLDAVLIGTRAEDPIRAAQRIFAFDSKVPVLLLTEPEWHEALCRAVQEAPFISASIRCLASADRDALFSAVNEAVMQVRKSRTHRRTLDALNARLSTASTHSASPAVFDTLLEHAPIGVVLADVSGAVRGCNRTASEILERSERTVLGAPLAEIFAVEGQARWEEFLRGLTGSARSMHRDEFRRVDRSGRTRHVEVTAASLRPYGGGAGSVLILQDVTDRVELLERLKRSVQARDEFISIAAHELRTPIASLRLSVHSLVRAQDREDASVVLKTRGPALERSSARLADLVESLLDVSRLQEGHVEITREPVDLGKVVRDVAKRYDYDVERAGCEMRLDVEEGVIGEWDRSRLEQVVTNLLFNAIKYGAGAPIEMQVKSDAAAGHASFTIRDHGIGIPESEQERIFERFERAVPMRSYGGFGLGLWIVRQIVRALGGEVRLRSRPNQGASFTVELPLRPADPAW